MKTITFALLLLVMVTSCKKEKYEKKVRKIEISFDESCRIQFNKYGWSNDCSKNTIVLYKKSGETLAFETIVCNSQNVNVKVVSGGKTLYDQSAKTHNVSLAID